uniref:Uncharacterized protein n=1 Tax=Rhizophora mucronata TaxID=61149 RepID=A0A2P2IM33_RHIMU
MNICIDIQSQIKQENELTRAEKMNTSQNVQRRKKSSTEEAIECRKAELAPGFQHQLEKPQMPLTNHLVVDHRISHVRDAGNQVDLHISSCSLS